MPSLHIYPKRYAHNLKMMSDLFHSHHVSGMVVTKVFCADEHLIQIVNQSDFEYIADSKIENLKHIETNKPKVLLRLPEMTQVEETIKFADISLNSELKVIKALNQAAEVNNQIHKIILMFDLGDLREGIYYKFEYMDTVKQILDMKYIELVGIGTNLTCFGGVIPDEVVYEKLKKIKNRIESTFKIELQVISGGNSSSIAMLLENRLPHFVNNLRIGEVLVLGRETAYGHHIDGMYDDVFELHAEIIELKEKPSMPEGELGMDAFGNKVSFEDQGLMQRAIIGIGRQDVYCENLIANDDMTILGCSSDHLMVEIKKGNYQVGDQVIFKMNYAGILSLSTSRYIRRVYEDNL